MKLRLSALVAAALLIPLTALTPHAVAQDATTCAPANELSFICDARRPEDLAHIPGTRWLIASGFADGAGLKLVDTDSKSMKVWFTGAADQIAEDKARYAACPGAPEVAVFNAHGIALKPKGEGTYWLYVVNHGGRQSIDVFTVDGRGDEPKLIWNGCVMMPDGASANSVSAYPDGTIIASVQLMNGKTLADSVNGIPTGGVFEWTPGSAGFRLLPGTAVPGNNGLEASPDGKEFYVIGFGVHVVFVYSRADTSRPVRQAEAPGFMPDNLHWDGDRLVLAGMVSDEPACGGIRKVVNGQADPMRCARGYVVAALDPASMTYSRIAYGMPNPVYNGVASAVIVGDTLWLGSYQSDKIAYRPLPQPMTPQP